MPSGLQENLVRPERLPEAPLPPLPTIAPADEARASTIYSEHRTKLSTQRTGLSEHRTSLSEFRTDLSTHRTDLSTDRTEMLLAVPLSVIGAYARSLLF